MKDYHQFPKFILGYSDIADLLIRGPQVDGTKEIHMGCDGEYSGYIITEPVELPERYKLVFETKSWLWLFDDYHKTIDIRAKYIKVYQCGSTLAFVIDGFERIQARSAVGHLVEFDVNKYYMDQWRLL